ncbi:MAG: PadR family transcriptional regulator [Gaiellaceae bacterium]
MDESGFPGGERRPRHHRRHGSHRSAGAHYFAGPPFGGPRGHRGHKARRGDIRTAALLLLAEEPRNGYQIMQEIEERSQGVWRPSPGSVYPTLQQLEDEGLVRSKESGGQRLLELTDAGGAELAKRAKDAPPPWEAMAGGVSDQTLELGSLVRQIGLAVMQVMQAGTEAQIEEARKVLTDSRRSLYRILAEGDEKS